MKTSGTVLGVIAFVMLLIVLTSVFTINQGQNGIILRLGRLVTEGQSNVDPKAVTEEDLAKGKMPEVKVLNPGLHFKIPFIESVRIFDTRLQTLDIKSSRIVTREKKDVIADYYVKWRIADLGRYFVSTGGIALKAENLLEQQINTYLRAEFGKRTISEVVSGGRDDVMEVLRNRAEEQASKLGIKVIDVRIKGIELPPTTRDAIYQRMRANMQKIAARHRADGNAEAEAIRAAADAQVTVIVAEAKSQGQVIRSRGQAQAAQIYAEAFRQDKDFYRFYRSLKAYMESFSSKRDILVLDQNSQFFDYFKKPLTGNSARPGN
ncbi:MAG: protease modulator HflC [Legionellaceae bacterium]|nr:protease modulator HflC [Legionellaceae bacterium]